MLPYTSMKTYALEDISSCERASAELRVLLPGQEMPWLLKAPDGDCIAYFKVGPKDLWRTGDKDLGRTGDWVTADISGRHYHEDAAVVSILRQLQSAVGGVIIDDDGAVL